MMERKLMMGMSPKHDVDLTKDIYIHTYIMLIDDEMV